MQAVLAGAAGLLPFALWLGPSARGHRDTDAAGRGLRRACPACRRREVSVSHPTEHAHLAAADMTRGRYARYFWPGLAATAAGVAAPWIGAAAVLFALLGLLADEHAYVQAGQSVPLA